MCVRVCVCVCVCVCTLVWHLFICCSGYQLLITVACLLRRPNSKGKQLSWSCFSERDFCSSPPPAMLHLTTERLTPVITASTVICCVSRHDGYLCTGHLSFPPSRASPRFMLSLSFSPGLLVICPAWVDSLKVSCSTLTTHPTLISLSEVKFWLNSLYLLYNWLIHVKKPDKCSSSFREVSAFTYKNFFWVLVCLIFLQYKMLSQKNKLDLLDLLQSLFFQQSPFILHFFVGVFIILLL